MKNKKLWIIILIVVLVEVLCTVLVHAETVIYVRPVTSYSVPELITYFADKYQVSPKEILTTVRCESGFRENAVGDSGRSFGLAQIYLPAHPAITKEQALDKVFAVEFMAKEFSQAHQRKWTCWRMNYM